MSVMNTTKKDKIFCSIEKKQYLCKQNVTKPFNYVKDEEYQS